MKMPLDQACEILYQWVRAAHDKPGMNKQPFFLAAQRLLDAFLSTKDLGSFALIAKLLKDGKLRFGNSKCPAMDQKFLTGILANSAGNQHCCTLTLKAKFPNDDVLLAARHKKEASAICSACRKHALHHLADLTTDDEYAQALFALISKYTKIIREDLKTKCQTTPKP